MRESYDEMEGGAVKNGFDYNLQVWVKNFKVILAGSIERTKKLNGLDIRELRKGGENNGS